MKDGILPKLGPDTWVMHDHNTINYNHNFHFRNIECNQHLLLYLSTENSVKRQSKIQSLVAT